MNVLFLSAEENVKVLSFRKKVKGRDDAFDESRYAGELSVTDVILLKADKGRCVWVCFYVCCVFR